MNARAVSTCLIAGRHHHRRHPAQRASSASARPAPPAVRPHAAGGRRSEVTQRRRPWQAGGRPIAAAATPPAAEAAISESLLPLPDGMRLELLHAPAAPGARAGAGARPPLLFIHGSSHGAWCWREHFLPFFAAAGWDCYAFSLRAQGGSDRGDLQLAGTLQRHADDLASVIEALPAPPVLVAHSFGAMLVEKYVGQLGTPGRPPVAGLALLAPTPPSGDGGIILRRALRSPVQAWKITMAFVAKTFVKSADDCRYAFFSEDLPPEDLARYHPALAACSPVRLLDLATMNKEVPLPPIPAAVDLPAFVGGGDTDLVVDIPAVEEAAAWARTRPVVWRRVAHDVMLDTRWRDVAESLLAWLEGL